MIHPQIYQMGIVFVGSFVSIFTLGIPLDAHVGTSVRFSVEICC